MCTHALTRTNQRLFLSGISLFVIADTALLVAQRSDFAGKNGVDALLGMLFGAAIGVLLLVLIRRHRAT